MKVYLDIWFRAYAHEKRYKLDEDGKCEDFEILREEIENVPDKEPYERDLGLKVMLKVQLIRCNGEYFIFGQEGKGGSPWGIPISKDKVNYLVNCDRNSFVNYYQSFPY